MTRLILPLALLATGLAAAATPVAYPTGYRGWTHAKSMILEPGHALYATFGGLHHVYVNDIGAPALQGGRTPYPDGTVFVFDLHEAKAGDKAVAEGSRKFLGVMRKDVTGAASTGGWAFEVFKGDTQERGVTDGGASCWGCHSGQADGVFTTWTK